MTNRTHEGKHSAGRAEHGAGTACSLLAPSAPILASSPLPLLARFTTKVALTAREG
jgi:hypothetical protein